MIHFLRPARSCSHRTGAVLTLVCLLLVFLGLPPVFASPNRESLLAQIASRAPQAGRRVCVDVYDTHTRQMQRLEGFAPQTAMTGGTEAGAQPMPPNPKLLRDPVKARQIAAAFRSLAHKPGLNGGGAFDRMRSHKSGSKAAIGTWHALVLLVDFSDKAPVFYPGSAAKTHFDSQLFEATPYTNSLQDYYKEASYGAFNLTGAAVGGSANWYRAPQTYDYYVNGNMGMGTYPNNSQKMVEDVCALADPDVDFAQYANDGSDYINALFVVHAGMGQEESGLAADMWSHQWQTSAHPVLDGKTLDTYSIEPENGQVGVFAHEFGHVLGLPDLYDYGYDSGGAGNFTLMAGGSWGGGGALPTGFDAWCRYKLGWITPTVLTHTASGLSVPQIEGNPPGGAAGQLIKLWNGPATDEYFLIENRQQVGFDASIPSNGLLIWHIDESMPNEDTQWYPPLDASLGHYLVALEQADGLWQMEHNVNQGDANDPWKSSIAGFSATSTPNSNKYSGAPGDLSVRNISTSGTTMTADFELVDFLPGSARSVAAFDTIGDSGGSITVTWNLSVDDGRGYNDVVQYDVMRADAAIGPFAKVATVAKGINNYVDTDVIDYTDYYYQIVTLDSVNSVLSKIAGPAAARDDLAPPAVTVTATDTPGDLGGSVSLSWSTYVPTPDFHEYHIYRSETPFTDVTGMTPLTVINLSSTKTYQDKTTVDNTDYYYAVTSLDNSQPNNELKLVTTAGPVRSNPNYAFSYPAGLSLVSIGLTMSENTLDKVFDLTQGAQMSRWEPQSLISGAYHAYQPGPTDTWLLQLPGRGFWLRTAQPMALNLSGAAATGDVKVDFLPGWNQLGNPYVDNVDIGTATVKVGGGTPVSLDESDTQGWTRNYMWAYDGAQSSYKLVSATLPFSTSTVKRGEGFFFLALRPGQLIIPNPSVPAPASAPAVAAPKQVAVDWSMRIVASTEGVGDTDNFLGVSGALAASDSVSCPPPARDGFDFYFSGNGAKTATSFVKSLGTGQSWQAEVACTRAHAAVKLSWPDLTGLPRDCRPILRDLRSGKSVYMRTVNGYSFTLGQNETRRRFVIEVSSKAGELLAIRTLQAGSVAGGAQIFYSLSAPASVDIEVINLAGRVVRRLASADAQSGPCSALWDGLTDSGSSAPGGSYLVRLSARTADGQAVSAVQTLYFRK